MRFLSKNARVQAHSQNANRTVKLYAELSDTISHSVIFGSILEVQILLQPKFSPTGTFPKKIIICIKMYMTSSVSEE